MRQNIVQSQCLHYIHVIAIVALLILNVIYLSSNTSYATPISTYMDTGVLFGVDEHWNPVGDMLTCNDLCCVLSNDILYNPNVTMIIFTTPDPYKSEVKLISPGLRGNYLSIPTILVCTWCSMLLFIDIVQACGVLLCNQPIII